MYTIHKRRPSLSRRLTSPPSPSSQHAASLCRPLAFFDGCFSHTFLTYHFLILTALDGEDEVIPVAFAIVDSETIDNCEWFFQNLLSRGDPAFKAWLSDKNFALYMDRGEGWRAAEKVLPNAHLMYVILCPFSILLSSSF